MTVLVPCAPQARSLGRARLVRAVEGQAVDPNWVGEQQARDCPLTQHIMAKRNSIAAEIAEGLARYQGVDRPGRMVACVHRLTAPVALLRECFQLSCAVPMATIVFAIGGFPPMLRHLNFSTRDRIPAGRLANRPRRNKFLATLRAG